MIVWGLAAFWIAQLAAMVYVWILFNRVERTLGDIAAILNDIKADIERPQHFGICNTISKGEIGMNILVGNDSKTTYAGLLGLAGQIALLFTGFMSVLALQFPNFGWLWAIIGATATFAFGCWRAWIMYKMNYIQSDPNIGTLASPAVVSVNTSGPTPDAPVFVKVNTPAAQ